MSHDAHQQCYMGEVNSYFYVPLNELNNIIIHYTIEIIPQQTHVICEIKLETCVMGLVCTSCIRTAREPAAPPRSLHQRGPAVVVAAVHRGPLS